ncbi:DUF4767 domain-containing protein [Fructobacillus sp. M2-14]|uniref:DUF4767 domain-containing protein n=1 Tax=Fructobacillus broussonetiae TaxID=2713173 RepID=A0ABS5QZU7_9LACO|nr:DUF4767 domain-containing protein [Fructobacillus broussonetiae]MBS9338728.1 DUF4767 domain-containing protein [Fructobacillus broussonetiae]
MKKSTVWTLAVVFAAVFIALMFILGKNSGQKDTTNKEGNTSSAAMSSSSSKKAVQAAKSFWSDDKNKALSSFMASWQKNMKQTYVGTYDDKEPNYYGILFPEELESGHLKNQVIIDGKQKNLSWNPSANEQDGLNVVAVAAEATQSMKGILYFFTVENNQPTVYVSTTNNGGQLYFQKSQNADLQKNFAKVFHS